MPFLIPQCIASNHVHLIPQPLTILKQAFFEILPDEELLQQISSHFTEEFYGTGTQLWRIGKLNFA
jgi:hypothetical protein